MLDMNSQACVSCVDMLRVGGQKSQVFIPVSLYCAEAVSGVIKLPPEQIFK